MALAAALLGVESLTGATTYNVTSTTDANVSCIPSPSPMPAGCSLRDTLFRAAAGDRINLSSAIYTISTTFAPAADNVTIAGAGISNTSINFQGNAASFYNDRVGTTLSGVTLTNSSIDLVWSAGGSLTLDACRVFGVAAGDNGIKHDSTGALTINNTIITANPLAGIVASPGSGAINVLGGSLISFSGNQGVVAYGALTVTNSTLTDNGTQGVNGFGLEAKGTGTVTMTNSASSSNQLGLYLHGSGAVNITDSSIDSNTLTGIIDDSPVVSLRGTTISRNGNCGIVAMSGTLNLANSTVSTNHSAADNGGGITLYSTAVANLNNVTVTGNYVHDGINHGGGVFVVGGGTLNLTNSILAGNLDMNGGAGGAPDCSGTLASPKFDLIGDTTQCTLGGTPTGNVTGQAPLLGPFQINGGPTATHELLAGSPALNAGSNGAPACETRDQRGEPPVVGGRLRSAGPRCDIGAVESDKVDLTVTSTQPATAAAGAQVTYHVTVSNDKPAPTSGNPATEVVLVETLPPGASLVSATPGSGLFTCSGMGPVVCVRPSPSPMPMGASESVDFVVTLPAGAGTAEASAAVSSKEANLVPADNLSIASIALATPDLASSGPADAGTPDDLATPTSDAAVVADLAVADLASLPGAPDLATAQSKPEDGGCACDLSGRRDSSSPWLLLLLLGALPLAHRRKRHPL